MMANIEIAKLSQTRKIMVRNNLLISLTFYSLVCVAACLLNFDKYPKLDEINEYLRKKAIENPDIVSLESVGKSHEGRDILMVKIKSPALTKSSTKNIVWIEAGL